MNSTEALYQAFSNAVTEDAGNVISNANNNELQFNQTVNIRVPKVRDRLLIDAKIIRKIKSVCEEAQKGKFTYAEVFLGIASLFLGAFLGSLMSQVPYELTFRGILSYTICPIGGIGFGVAYWFCRKNDMKDIKYWAEKVSEYIEDSDEADMEEDEYEH